MHCSYDSQKEQFYQRLDVKTCETMLHSLILKGTNCSRFESESIVETVKEVFLINEHSELERVKPGQMKKVVISAQEPAGKKLSECCYTHILISFDAGAEDVEVYKEGGTVALRHHRLVRICDEARQQEGLFSQEDLALLLGCDVRTIRKDIARLKKKGISVPTRGHQKDIGPGVCHRQQAVRLFIQNKEPLEIARHIKHSLKAIERYINTFCRVVFLYQRDFNPLQIAFALGISYTLTTTYITLYQEYKNKKEYQDRLTEVQQQALPFFEALDSLKKTLHNGRRQK